MMRTYYDKVCANLAVDGLCKLQDDFKVEIENRDRLWCAAILNSLDTDNMEKVLKKFHELEAVYGDCPQVLINTIRGIKEEEK
jgi:hypothetical protein